MVFRGRVGDWMRDFKVSRGWQRRRERRPEEREERREIWESEKEDILCRVGNWIRVDGIRWEGCGRGTEGAPRSFKN